MQGKELREAIANDPIIQEAREARFRTVANAFITLADMVPVVGDFVSWSADAMKFFPKLNIFTPDVSKKVAVGTELLEIPGAMVAPTHLIEATMQFNIDRKRMKAGKERLQELREA